MSIHQKFCALIVLIGLMIAAPVRRGSGQTALIVNDSGWSLAGAASMGGAFTNFLMLPTVNPQIFDAPFNVVFGNTLTVGTGSDTFSAVPVNLIFAVTLSGITHNFVAAGTISGSISDTSSDAPLSFVSLTDTTSGQIDTDNTFTDPGSFQQALFLNTDVGGIYVDYAEPTPIPTQNSGTVSGYIDVPLVAPSVPEPGSIALLLSFGGGLLGLRVIGRHRRR